MSRVDFPPSPPRGLPLLRLGFRPFFLAAGLWGALAMLLWSVAFTTGRALPMAGLSPSLWHAHEMLFGYTAAVIAGFLLTAVGNWTGRRTVTGAPLALLVAVWLAARLLMLFAATPQWGMAAGLLALAGVVVAAAIPVFRVRQWRQLPILAVPAGMLVAQGWAMVHPRAGVYAGLLLAVLLLTLIGRRIIPFFIERGLGDGITIDHPRALEIAAPLLIVVYALAEMIAPVSPWTAWLASLAAMVHAVRLGLWHRRAIWRRPMLWVLWLGYAWLVAGLALRAASLLLPLSPFVSLHALTVGAIGLMTLGMMCRVTLGHTGRDVLAPPAGTGLLFVLLAAAAVVRVMLPLLLPAHSTTLVLVAQGLWIAALGGFVLRYASPLLSPRVDGRDG